MHIHCDETNIYTYYIVCSQDVTTVHFYILYYCFVFHDSIYTCTRSTCNSHIGLVVSECDRDTKHIAFSVQRRVEWLIPSHRHRHRRTRFVAGATIETIVLKLYFHFPIVFSIVIPFVGYHTHTANSTSFSKPHSPTFIRAPFFSVVRSPESPKRHFHTMEIMKTQRTDKEETRKNRKKRMNAKKHTHTEKKSTKKRRCSYGYALIAFL